MREKVKICHGRSRNGQMAYYCIKLIQTRVTGNSILKELYQIRATVRSTRTYGSVQLELEVEIPQLVLSHGIASTNSLRVLHLPSLNWFVLFVIY